MKLPFGYILETEFYGGFLAFVGLLVLGIIFIVLMNKRGAVTRGNLGKSSYLAIVTFRTMALLLLLFMIFNPEISLKRTQSLPKRVALIVDRSQSMRDAWKGSESELRTSIAEYIKAMDKHYNIDFWSMDGDVISMKDIAFTKDVSAFTWSPNLSEVGDDQIIYKAAFIISDGHLNRGRSPLDYAWTKLIPIFPIFPLEPYSNNLLKISDLKYSAPGKDDPATQIRVKVRQEGLIGQVADVFVMDELERVLGERSFQLSGGLTEIAVPVKLERERSYQLKVQLALKDGTLKSESPIEIKYDKTRKHVLLTSEYPNELHKLLLLNLPDSLFTVTSILGTQSTQVKSQNNNLNQEKYDLVILNEPGDQLLRSEAKILISEARESSIPMIIFHTGLGVLDAQWKELLGVQQLKSNKEGFASAYWNTESFDHPLYLGLKGRGFLPENMINYPPLLNYGHMLNHQGSVLLTMGSGEGAYAALILADNPPVAVFNGSHFWKWFFHPQSSPSFKQFWTYLLEYLEEIAEFEPVQLEVSADRAATGDYLTASVSIKDIDKTPISTADLHVFQQEENGSQQSLAFTRVGPGVYAGNISTKHAGKYVLIAQVFRFGELWGSDTSRIRLVAYDEENQSSGVDEVFLSRLVEHSAGGMVIYEKEKLPVLSEKYYEKRSEIRVRGLRSPVFFVLMVLCFIGEWFLRRRSGLL